MIPYLIAIDPGACTGHASFVDGHLVNAGICDRDTAHYWRCIPRFDRCDSLIVVIEKPQDYPGSRRKANPNDLITLALNVGELSRHYQIHGAIVELVLPQQWKGQAPKAINNARTLAALIDAERAILPVFAQSFQHNMYDAIGIGLWYLHSKGVRNAT